MSIVNVGKEPLAVSRLKPAAWSFVAVFALIVAALAAMPWLTRNDPHPIEGGARVACFAFAAVLAVLPAAGAWEILSRRIVATEDGLIWRGYLKRLSASWDEVLDYYDDEVRTGNHFATRSFVETASGKLYFSASSTNTETLKGIIQARALRARARAWGRKGARAEDSEPQEFTYDNKELKGLHWLPIAGTGAGLYMAWMMIPKLLAHDYDRYIPLGLRVLMWLVAIAVILMYPAMTWIVAASRLQGLRERRRQRLTATAEGLTLTDGERRVTIEWPDVRAYYIEAGRGFFVRERGVRVVEGTGGRIDFTSQLVGARLLAAILPARAVNAPQTGWEDRRRVDVLGGERSLWTGQAPGAGDRVYHYRMRTVRAVLWLLTAYMLTMAVALTRKQPGELPTWRSAAGHPELLLIPLALIYVWWRYRAARIVTGWQGITQYSLLRKATIAWQDVERYYIRGQGPYSFGIVVGGGRRVWFSPLIAESDGLMAEIRKSATSAVTKDWERPY